MRALERHGYACVGIELDDEIAAEARAAGLDVRTLDMRELDRLPETFDAVLSMWASFGWFDDEENERVLRALAAKVAPGGVLVLELFDREWFEPRQGPYELRPGIVETKRVEGSRLYVEYDRGGSFEWRLYEPEELAAGSGLTLGVVDRSPERARVRVVLHASPASRAASAADPITSDATVR
jgi:SAM-dependent methyltransferase